MIVNNKYKIQSELGSGAFGKLYMGRHIYTDELVAIKLQAVDGAVVIQNEAKILKLLLDVEGVPKIKTFGKQDGIYYMVIELLSEPVERLFKNISNKRVLNYMVDLVRIIERVHNSGVIHRDIKPDNILFTNRNKICLIDFGLSTMYMDSKGNHISQILNRDIIGSNNYISIHIHNGSNPSRRDDLISICYMAFKFIAGVLPWDSSEMCDVGVIKQSINIREYYREEIPFCIFDLYDYCNGIEFKETPNYDYICKQFII